jgi:hypothetical protein
LLRTLHCSVKKQGVNRPVSFFPFSQKLGAKP